VSRYPTSCPPSLARPLHAFVVTIALAAVALVASAPSRSSAGQLRCRATPADGLGPFYEPGAPLRAKVGDGYLLSGTVRSVRTCLPIARARIEFWLANPEGQYDDAHRATVLARRDGRYRFESNRPVRYSSRPPHIHIRVSARGFRTLVTQHYPREGQTRARFDLVVRPT
jgi:protocatechuate 3,4-dioxygenase beta subunit